MAKAADAELRALADVFKMDDMNSASRDRGAKIVKPQPPPVAGPVHTFAPGFSAALGNGGAVCVPTTSQVNFKAKVGMGNRLSHSRTVPGVHSHTAIEASHRPKP